MDKVLFQRELQILGIICRADKPVTMKDIIAIDPNMKMGTVIDTVTKLLDRELINVSGTEMSYKTVTRKFVPSDKARDFIKGYISDIYSCFMPYIPKEEIIKTIQEL